MSSSILPYYYSSYCCACNPTMCSTTSTLITHKHSPHKETTEIYLYIIYSKIVMHICVLVLKNIRITFWVLGWCGFITRKYDINKNKSDVEITKILLLVPGIHQWSGVCNKFPQPSTSDIWSTLYSGIKYAPLVVRAASLSTVSSSSLSAKRVPTRTWPRSQVAGPPCLLLSLRQSRFFRPPMPPFPPEVNTFDFYYCCFISCIVYNLHSRV